ncbi:MAG: MopE-related protein, partial [Myxococcota bacterium]
PEAAETWYDGVDQDCDGASDFDQDIDGYDSDAFGGDDCDDSSAGANPGASETWYDGVDQNCDGASDYDADGDGYDGDAYGGSDCDDSDAGFNPGVVEAWDYEDTDCDGQGDVENLGDVAVRFSGEGAGDAAGRGLATGDVDGDGFDDIVVSSLYNDDGGTNAGAIHLVLGSASPTSGSLSSHIQFTGDTPEEPGHSVAIGDVDADGYSDVLMGAIYNSDAGSIAGAAYLLLGSAAPTSVPLSSAIQLTGVTAGDYAGYDVASAGDVDADGYGDLLVSAYNYDGGGTDAGAVFLSLGSSTPSSASLSGMVRFTGEAAGDQAGDSTNGAGDVDGDGYDDVLVGAWENDDNGTSAGAVYLLLGGPSPSSRGLAAADAQYVGEAAGDRAGVSCAGGIDFDADGYGDVVVGAYMNDDGGSGAGAAYVILGSASPSGRSLSTADAQFTGESAGDEAGVSVAGAGDVNADAHDDVVLGAFHHSDAGLYAGAAYVVLGSASPVSLGLSDAEAQVTGETAGGLAGLSVAGGGDVNDDGYDEVLVSAPYTSNGDAYLILGTGR